MDIMLRQANFGWLISCAADRMMPEYLEDHHRLDWHNFVWQGVVKLTGQGVNWWEIRWDCVRSYAMNRMWRHLASLPSEGYL